MKRVLGMLAALAVAGCYEDECNPMYCVDPSENADNWSLSHLRSTLSLDPELSEREQSAAIQAAQSWQAALGSSVQISLVPGEATERFAVRRARPGELKPGMLASARGTVIAIGESLEGSGYLQGGLTHEFGHYLGLGHEPELPDDIMYPCTHDGMPSVPTPDAVHDLQKLYDL